MCDAERANNGIKLNSDIREANSPEYAPSLDLRSLPLISANEQHLSLTLQG